MDESCAILFSALQWRRKTIDDIKLCYSLLFNKLCGVFHKMTCHPVPEGNREKERFFEDFSVGYRGLIEIPVFANPFVSSTFMARKKSVE